jgi:thioester reductase-like protein
MNNGKTLLITGGTGVVGSRLLLEILKKMNKVYVLVRDRSVENGNKRVLEALGIWNYRLNKEMISNLNVVKGDITENDLGIRKKEHDRIKNEIDEIWHCAAATEFNGSLKRLNEANVLGTENVMKFGMQCAGSGRLIKVNYVSTAYVCGNYRGDFKEKDLELGQEFNTNYEKTKYIAEKKVKVYQKRGLWVDVYRPSAVIGEIKTGRIPTFKQAFYRILHLLNAELYEKLPVEEGQSIDVVCVDELCRSLCLISANTNRRNMTYHPFANEPLSLMRILDYSCKLLGHKRPLIVGYDKFIKTKPTYSQIEMLKYNLFFLNNNVHLNSCSTNIILNKYGFKYSKIKKQEFCQLLRYPVRTGFLKNKCIQ